MPKGLQTMNETLRMLLIICPLVFLAGFVDSIAGGGGLISLPAYIFAGLPVKLAYGTNKFAMSLGTFISATRFIRSGKVAWKSAGMAAISALAGSYLGARAALALEEKYLKYCLLVLLPAIAVFMLTRKNFGEKDTWDQLPLKKMAGLSVVVGFTIGAYDGFFGPGTGSFLILAFTGLLGFSLTIASGNAKVVNLASNIAALVAFIGGGKVAFLIGIPAALCAILGNWLGSGLAIRSGAKIIKPVFIGVIVLLFLKISQELFHLY
jgi:uncharacterized protein